MKYFILAAACLLVLLSSCEKFYESFLSHVVFSVHNLSSDTLYFSSYICYTGKDEVYCYMNNQPILYPNDSIEASFHFDASLDESWSYFFMKEKIDSVLIILSSTQLNYQENHSYENVLEDSSIVRVFPYNPDMAERSVPTRFVYP